MMEIRGQSDKVMGESFQGRTSKTRPQSIMEKLRLVESRGYGQKRWQGTSFQEPCMPLLGLRSISWEIDRQRCKILSKVGNGVRFVFLKAPYDGKIEAMPLKGTITAIKQTISVRTNPHWKRQREYCCDNPEVDVPEDQNEGGKPD